MLYLQNLRLKRSINKIRSMARSLGGKWGRCNINIFVPHTHTHTAAEKTNRWLYSSETLVLETAWPQERRIRRTAQLGLVQVILPQWPKDARRRREIWKPGEPRVCVCAIILCVHHINVSGSSIKLPQFYVTCQIYCFCQEGREKDHRSEA